MWVDALKIYNFYHSSQGEGTQGAVRLVLQDLWPRTNHQVIVSFGYGFPFLEPYLECANRVLFCMPTSMGAFAWPPQKKNLACLCENDSIPFPDNSVHKLLISHALEFYGSPDIILKEAWRVLVPGGELVVMTPNRRGLWSRAPQTPFGNGNPYTGRQLFSLLEGNNFTPSKPQYCLFQPPVFDFVSFGTLEGIERFGRRWTKKLGGLVMICGEKKILGMAKNYSSSPFKKRIFNPFPS